MIDLAEIEETIDKFITTHDTSFYTCSKLADMFIVLDHLRPERPDDRATQDLRGSEFLEASSGVSYPALMGILNDHMEALRVVQPREYQAVIDRIRSLR